MIQGYGDVYRQGLADWNAIIDGLVKPTFDGVLALPDLGGAVAEARAAALPDPRQAALKRKIAEIRARVPAGSMLQRADSHALCAVFTTTTLSSCGRRVPLEMFAAHADLVAHEFIAELEGVQPVAGDGAVAQADHHAAQDRFQFVLQFVEGVEDLGVFHPLADIENGGRELAGLLRRDPRDLGVDGGKDRADDAERRQRRDTSCRCSDP